MGSLHLSLSRQGWHSADIKTITTMNFYVIMITISILSFTQSALKLYSGGLFNPGPKRDSGKNTDPLKREQKDGEPVKSFSVFGDNDDAEVAANTLNFGAQFSHRFSKGTSFQNQQSFTGANKFPYSFLPTNQEVTPATSTTTTSRPKVSTTTATTTTQPSITTVEAQYFDISQILYGKYGKFEQSFVL